MASSNCYAGCMDCDESSGTCYDDFDAGLSTSGTPSTGTNAASNTVTTPAASSSSLLSIFSGLAGLIQPISAAVNGPTTQASLSATPTVAQPYPVTVNGKIVGYSSVPAAASSTTGTTINTTDLVLFGILAFGVYWLATKK